MKRTIELEDTLQQRVDSAIEDVKAELLRHCDENEPDALPDLGNDLNYSGAIDEIIDGSVPISTHEIKTVMFLHGDDVEDAFDNAGIGEKTDEGWPSGWHAAAIYCYIEQQVGEWYSTEAEDVFETWKASRPIEEEDAE